MMIKVFTLNKYGNIELTEEELKKLLDDAYWDGYRDGGKTYTWSSPTTWSPYTWTSSTTQSATISGNNVTLGETNATVTLNKAERVEYINRAESAE